MALVASQAAADLPALIVSPGETKQLAAQRYEFSSVEIKSGGTLLVSPGGDMLHLVVRGPVRLQGSIVARGFGSDERQVFINIKDQPPLTIAYRNTNRAGPGGDGGSGADVSGGRGTAGDSDEGGGGGAGGGRHQDATGTRKWPGQNAAGSRGGAAGPMNCGGRGGSGVRRGENANGGIVFLEVFGDFDGTGGVIDVSGIPGDRGADGQPTQFPTSSYGCQGGAGGGGGGAPGGQGGSVVGYVTGSIAGYPQAKTAGGRGGEGGASPGNTDRFRGQPGGRGQTGAGGAAYWCTPARPCTR